MPARTPPDCETRCTHDLARGIQVADLLREDGPWPTASPLWVQGLAAYLANARRLIRATT